MRRAFVGPPFDRPTVRLNLYCTFYEIVQIYLLVAISPFIGS